MGINTLRSNSLVEEALENDLLEESLEGFVTWRREVPVAEGRLDFLLGRARAGPDCYVEVKNVTAAVACKVRPCFRMRSAPARRVTWLPLNAR